MQLSMTISRDGESDLELNDGPYLVAKEGLNPGEISYSREQVSSPYIHGQYTTYRTKESPNAQIVINVSSGDHTSLKSDLGTLIDAFSQEVFTLTLVMNGAQWQWQGEAANYSVGFVSERMHALNVPAGFQFPRHPIPKQGPF
jgi:hypothetical protein